MFCRHCGNQIADEASVCIHCGVPVGKGKRFCHHCGAEHAEEAVVCVKCGVSFEQTAAQKEEDFMESLKSFRSTLDSLPWVAALLLVLFADGLFGGLYRLTKGDTTGIVVGILWFVTGGFFGIGMLIDLICIIANKKITFLA